MENPALLGEKADKLGALFGVDFRSLVEEKGGGGGRMFGGVFSLFGYLCSLFGRGDTRIPGLPKDICFQKIAAK